MIPEDALVILARARDGALSRMISPLRSARRLDRRRQLAAKANGPIGRPVAAKPRGRGKPEPDDLCLADGRQYPALHSHARRPRTMHLPGPTALPRSSSTRRLPLPRSARVETNREPEAAGNEIERVSVSVEGRGASPELLPRPARAGRRHPGHLVRRGAADLVAKRQGTSRFRKSRPCSRQIGAAKAHGRVLASSRTGWRMLKLSRQIDERPGRR